MSYHANCPRCGGWRCEWTDEELFCPDCLLCEGPEDFKYREENPYEDLDPEMLTFMELLEDDVEEEDLLTQRINEKILAHNKKFKYEK